MGQLDNFSKEELREAVNKFDTWREIISYLGIKDTHNKYVPYLKQRLDFYGIDYSSLYLNPIQRKGYSRNQYTKYKDEEIFVKNSKVSLSTVRRAFKKRKDIIYKCAICDMPPIWQGKPLVLTMDHIDGDTTNNELSNLRWICPNCDRQLDTYAGRNKSHDYKRAKKEKKDICPICGGEKERRANVCRKCADKQRSTYIKNTDKKRPTRDELKELIRNNSFSKLGKDFGISDNGIKRWCQSYNLPCKKSEINAYSDYEWSRI